MKKESITVVANEAMRIIGDFVIYIKRQEVIIADLERKNKNLEVLNKKAELDRIRVEEAAKITRGHLEDEERGLRAAYLGELDQEVGSILAGGATNITTPVFFWRGAKVSDMNVYNLYAAFCEAHAALIRCQKALERKEGKEV